MKIQDLQMAQDKLVISVRGMMMANKELKVENVGEVPTLTERMVRLLDKVVDLEREKVYEEKSELRKRSSQVEKASFPQSNRPELKRTHRHDDLTELDKEGDVLENPEHVEEEHLSPRLHCEQCDLDFQRDVDFLEHSAECID